MLSFDETNIQDIGRKKTALFVVVSDMDRSFDKMANIFFTQAMAELCRVADHECEDQRLPIPVRFILDDFATNCKIKQFPRMISSIRSRGFWMRERIPLQPAMRERWKIFLRRRSFR